MYICKSQLGIEKEFEQKVLPDGRLNIDGFVVVYDVSAVPGLIFEIFLLIVRSILISLMINFILLRPLY